MDDIMIEIDDRGDADTILAALNTAAAQEYDQAREVAGLPALAAFHLTEARRYDRIARRFEVALDPEPEPPDFEPEPPLPKDDPDLYSGPELLTIQRQSVTAGHTAEVPTIVRVSA